MRMSYNQRLYVEFVRQNPGCTIAAVNRACKHNPLAGHKWVYDGVARLVRRGILVATGSKSRKSLTVGGAA